MTEQPFIGQIELFGFNFAHRGWAFCDGQLLSIVNNTALFSLLGTMYGGDGVNTFAVPNLNSRVALGVGTRPAGSTVVQGETGGAENASLAVTNLPSHNHTLAAQSGTGTTSQPAGAALAQVAEDDGTPARSYSSAGTNTTLSSASIGNTGGGQPVAIRNPYLGLNYAIALEGIYPSRN